MRADTEARAIGPGALGLPMSRVGSGTAWLPDDASVSGGWHLMLHGNVFAGYDYQAGDVHDIHAGLTALGHHCSAPDHTHDSPHPDDGHHTDGLHDDTGH